MADHIYIVQRRSDGWFIRYDGCAFGPFGTSDEALLEALDAAHEALSTGTSVSICVDCVSASGPVQLRAAG